MNFCHWAGQHVFVEEQEVGILAFLDAASLILKEHLLGDIDGQGLERLLTGNELFRPPGLAFFTAAGTVSVMNFSGVSSYGIIVPTVVDFAVFATNFSDFESSAGNTVTRRKHAAGTM